MSSYLPVSDNQFQTVDKNVWKGFAVLNKVVCTLLFNINTPSTKTSARLRPMA